YDRACVSQLCPPLAFKLCKAIDTLGPGLITLCVETILLAIEHVVSRDRYERGSYFPTAAGKIFRTLCISRIRSLLVELATVYIRPRCAIDNNFRLIVSQRFNNPIPIANVEAAMIIGKNCISTGAAVI